MKTTVNGQPKAGGLSGGARRGRAGFTMIELLTVITDIMILAALVLGAAAYAGRKADDSRCQAYLQRIKNALEEYKMDYGKYPQQGLGAVPYAALFGTPVNPAAFPTGGRPNGDHRPYISETNNVNSSLQFMDPWGNYIRYQAPGTHNKNTYDLWSFGPNGVDDSLNTTTSDDLNNWSSGR